MAWSEVQGASTRWLLWRRDDGAIVKYAMGPRTMEWIAYEPDPSEDYLIRRSKRGMGWPRRWKSAEAAMRAVDKEYPQPTPPAPSR